MKAVKKAIAALLVVVFGFGVVITSQMRLDQLHEEKFYDELLYLPNEKLLTHFTAGLNSVVADMLWLQCIQYTAKHFRGDGKYVWLDHMGDIITDLDPYFVEGYKNVATFLAALKADGDASIELLQKGIVHNPDRWELPYDIAMVYLLNRKDEPHAPEMAAEYLKMAAAMPGAPASIAPILEGLSAKHGFEQLEREMWEERLDSDDAFMRDMAERKLHLLDIRKVVDGLNEMTDGFEDHFGRRPANFEELFSAQERDVPPQLREPDPLGGAYFMSDDGEAMNTSLLDETAQRRINRIQSMVRAFNREEGRLPESLAELIRVGLTNKLPEHPYPGEAWEYNPATGEVTSSIAIDTAAETEAAGD